MDLRAGETLPLAFLAGFDSLSKVKLKLKVRSPKPDTAKPVAQARASDAKPVAQARASDRPHFHVHRNERENENLNFFFYIYTLFVLGDRKIVACR